MQKKIQLYSPHTNQKPVHIACNDMDTFFITVNAGRQSGKTALSQQQCLYWALNNEGVCVYWVSPTASQATKVYKQILEMIVDTPVLLSNKGSLGDCEIILVNGSIIKFRSSASEDSLRGETIDYLIIDEAAFVKESVFQEILLPMLNVRGRKCLMISTPRGKNWFYTQYQKGINNFDKCKSFKFTSLDNPYSNKDILELAKASLPDVLYRQEYLGHFIDSSAIFENVQELATITLETEPTNGMEYWIGVDIALKDDYTVITVINQNDEVVCYERFNHITAPELKNRLIACFELWKPRKIFIEENNQGLPIIHDLQITHKVRNIVGFKTTSKSKPEIINNLINAFASKKINIPKCEIYTGELEMFTMTVTPTGHVKFAAPQGFNDDIPMSLAIAWECRNKNRGSGKLMFDFLDM